MKKFVIALLVSLLSLSPAVFAESNGRWNTEVELAKCTHYEVDIVASTDTNTPLTYARDSKAVYVENTDATNEVWIDLDDGVATAGSGNEIRLDAGQNRSVNGFQTHKIGVINSSSETATVKVEVCW